MINFLKLISRLAICTGLFIFIANKANSQKKVNHVKQHKNDLKQTDTYNYVEAFQKTIWFLEVQRAGKVSSGVTLPDGTIINNRVNWRSDSYLNDGKSIKSDPFEVNGTPDLTGGWFDAGDPPKWSTAMSSAATMLAWGIIEYPNAYKTTGQLLYSKGNLKWINDYFLKCFKFDPLNPDDVSKYRIYIIVGGSGGASGPDKYQGKVLSPSIITLNEQVFLSCQHETIENTIFNLSDFPNYQRPVYYADKDAPACPTIALIASSMASASIVFWGDESNAGEVAYANLLLERSKMLFNFANQYLVKSPIGVAGARSGGTLKNKDGNLVDSDFAGGRWDKDINMHRPGVGYSANMCWASLWLHGAELKKNMLYGDIFLKKAIDFTNNSLYPLPPLFEDGSRGNLFVQTKDDWGNKLRKLNANPDPNCYILFAKYLGADTEIHNTETTGGKGAIKFTYGQMIESLADASLASTITASGMPEWGYPHLALGSMQAPTFSLLVIADKILKPNHPKFNNYISFARSIIDYGLGSNKYNRSFLVGFNPPGKISSINVLHGPSQGFWDGPVFSWNPSYPGSDELGDFSKVKPRHTCYGGLTSPSFDGTYDPNAYSGSNQEVGPVYQQGLEGNFARMIDNMGNSGGGVLTDFPSIEPTDGKEYFVKVKELVNSSKSVKLSAIIVNHSAWPAVMRNKMSFRYYFTREANTSVTVKLEPNTTYPLGGVTISDPLLEKDDLFYIEASFNNINIYPGGCKESPDSQLDPIKFPRIPHYEMEIVFTLTSSGDWNNFNDWSHIGVGTNPTSRGYSMISNIPVYDDKKLLSGNLPGSILAVETAKDESDFVIYPNPNSNKVLNVSTQIKFKGILVIQVLSVKGELVHQKEFNVLPGVFNEKLYLNHIATGTYIIQLKGNGVAKSKKIILE